MPIVIEVQNYPEFRHSDEEDILVLTIVKRLNCKPQFGDGVLLCLSYSLHELAERPALVWEDL